MHTLRSHEKEPLAKSPTSLLFATKWSETEWRWQIHCFSCVMGVEWEWHSSPRLWMIMWQVATLPSHWDQLSEVSGALSTQEAALVHRAQPSHQQPLTSPYQPCFSDWINPHPPHTWLLTLSDSSWEITQLFSTQLSICFFLWFQMPTFKMWVQIQIL